MVAHAARRLFTVDEYHQMAEAGILGEDDRVELIEGEIVEMSPIGWDHASVVNRLNEILVVMFRDVATVSPQNPIRLSRITEPEPDIVLIRRGYTPSPPAPPGAPDIVLVVEVADSSLAYDRRTKMPLYARSGVAEAWLVDVSPGTITVFRDPTPEGYESSSTVGRGEEVALAAFPDRPLQVADVLG
jgi:Uma2 family endonuclease